MSDSVGAMFYRITLDGVPEGDHVGNLVPAMLALPAVAAGAVAVDGDVLDTSVAVGWGASVVVGEGEDITATAVTSLVVMVINESQSITAGQQTPLRSWRREYWAFYFFAVKDQMDLERLALGTEWNWEDRAEPTHLHAGVTTRAQEALALGGNVRELPLEEVHDGVASVHPVGVLLGDGDGRQGGQQQQEGAHDGGGRARERGLRAVPPSSG
ncbi:Protein of unknown function [Gryllus bimaculatus]|nr:Protein of unknown function [Gryllus bimaculatus]